MPKKNTIDQIIQNKHGISVKEWLIASAQENMSMGSLARSIGVTTSAISRRASKYGIAFDNSKTSHSNSAMIAKSDANGTIRITADNILSVPWR